MNSQLEIRLLGGFEVRFGGEVLSGFESQKVRALLAYLASHADQPQDRGHLAALLWPEENAKTGRQNLRQAAYNLRVSLGAPTEGRPEYLLGSHQTLQLNLDADIWLDITAFEQAAKRGLKSGIEADVAWLTEASRIYRGHLLPAFAVKDSEEFENWLWDRREQLRELAVRNLRVLTGCHLENGDYALGIDHARLLVELDPLSEEAHRTLIHLYFLAGRRSQALLEYESFAKRLEAELDVKPLSETTALYESILTDSAPGPPTASRPDPVGPFVTLEGRDDEMEELLDVWREVVGGETRAVLIDGPSGVGKSRLVKTFLHRATSESRGTVLRCRAYSLSAPRVYGPIIELLRNAWRVGRAESRQRFQRLRIAELNLVRVLLSDLVELELLESIDPVETVSDQEELFDAVTTFLLAASGASGTADYPTVLFVDDAQWADPASLDYLTRLMADPPEAPLLLILTCREDLVGPEQSGAIATLRGLDHARSMSVEAVGRDAVAKMVESVAEAGDQEPLTEFLAERSDGQPLIITETINYLCDLGHMIAGGGTRWRLTRPAETLSERIPSSVDELIRRRIARLPSSTRRLLAHAALIGQRFDFHLLRQAADEHALVVETAIGLMLEHWLGRQFPDAWASTHQERDIVLWAQGARRGTFEFAHKAIRNTLFHTIPERRRRILHREIAEAIERSTVEGADESSEELAYHYLRAEAWAEAVVFLRQAAERAARLCAYRSAHSYCVDALDTLARLQAGATNRNDRARWRRLERDVDGLRSEVAERLGSDALTRYPSLSITAD